MVSPLTSRIRKLKAVLAGTAILVAAVGVPALAQATRVAPLYQQNQNAQPQGQPNAQLPQAQGPNSQLPPPPGPRGGDLILGPGDVLQIQVADEPDLNGKYLVSDSGEISVPMVPKPVRAEGLTTTQLSAAIARELKAAEILQQPVVSVFVDEYHSHTITVVGAVVRPGLYAVETHTTVLEAISEAGGLLPNAGNEITIAKAGSSTAVALQARAARPQGAGQHGMPGVNPGKEGATVRNASLETPPPASRDVERLDFSKLISGKDPSLNVQVKAGDVVSVGTAPVIYIVGAVMKPGAFSVENSTSQITVLQALALVQGMTPVASAGHAVIVRNSGNEKERKEIPINIDKVKDGKEHDQYLQANDILFVPESGTKKSLHALGSIATRAASEVAGYGLGIRLGAF
jgi:polysaccharide biosynthesis/export protein